jgi:GNAT superfamily N-acetyltransferase
MTSAPSLPIGEGGEQQRAVDTLVSAFTEDPVMRWLYPSLEHYRADFPKLLVAFGGAAFDAQTAWRLGDFAAVALWMPPGVEAAEEPIIGVFTSTVAASQHEDLFAVLDQMGSAHPATTHWYLPWFGVDAALQGQGLGGELMRSCLEIVDKAELPAYLETPNPRNIPFYERHGFTVTGVAQAGACPPVSFMWRESH